MGLFRDLGRAYEHTKTDHHEFDVYSDTNGGGSFGNNVCLDDYSPTRGSSGWNEVWIENTCVLYQNPVPYNIVKCDTGHLFVPYIASNEIYLPAGAQVAFTCEVNGSDARLNLEK